MNPLLWYVTVRDIIQSAPGPSIIQVIQEAYANSDNYFRTTLVILAVLVIIIIIAMAILGFLVSVIWIVNAVFEWIVGFIAESFRRWRK